MNKLFDELQRLYFLPDQHWLSQKFRDGGEPAYTVDAPLTPEIIGQSLAGELGVTLNLLSAEDTVRTMLVVFTRAADWEVAGRLFQAVQDDLGLPAPAISVSGRQGFRLWFSLAEPVPAARARSFLAALQRRYLADAAPADLQFRPDLDALAATGPALVKLTPALHRASGKWSAFIDPSLGSMFIDEPGLAMAPNMDKQAQILSGIECIKPEAFHRALELLPDPPPAPASRPEAAATAAAEGGSLPSRLAAGGHFSDPESFLLAVMNDPAASTLERIRAAEALLPKFARGEQK